MGSSILSVYNRHPVGFVAGKGARLTAEDGSEYLDFGVGVAVNALGHAHPHLVTALSEQAAQAVAHLQPLPDPRGRAAGGAADRRDLRRHGVLHQFRRRGAGMRHQDGAALSPFPAAQPERFRHRSPSRAPSMAGRWRRSRPAARRNISRASARRSTASTRCRSAISTRSRRRSAMKPPAFCSSRCRAKAACASCPAASCRALRAAVRRAAACCWSSTRCSAAWAAPASCSPMSAADVTPDIMAIAKAHRRRLSARGVPGDGGGRQRHDGRLARLDLSAATRSPWRSAMRCSTWCWPTGFSRTCGASALRLKQELAAPHATTYPSVIEEMRGDGLLIGLNAPCPNLELVQAALATRICSRSRPATMSCACCRR